MSGVGLVLSAAISAYLFLFFVRLVMSFVPLFSPGFTPHGVMLVLFEGVFTITDPLIRLYEALIPPLRFRGWSLSLGFLAAWLTLVALQRLVWWVFG